MQTKIIPPENFPYCHKILYENSLLHNGKPKATAFVNSDISFYPSRVLMQDYTGVPALLDIISLGQTLHKELTLKVPVHLVVDHSISIEKSSLQANEADEFAKNKERLHFLKWAKQKINNLHIVPPGNGICHQINLEYLAKVVNNHGDNFQFDTVIGTDSHTPMVNALGVLGFGVGGIEAESVMLGLPISLKVPPVICCQLSNQLKPNVTSTDLVLHITNVLRQYDLVGKMLEFDGDGLDYLTLEDRATIANMAPEFGATTGLFPIDNTTIEYLKLTGRKVEHIIAHAKKTGVWRNNHKKDYAKVINIDLSEVRAKIAGPDLPHALKDFATVKQIYSNMPKSVGTIKHGDVVIAAITSCTNTSNPKAIITAALLAKKAVALGLKPAKFTKCSFAPGSKVVFEYLQEFNLLEPLAKLGFNISAYGCTTCIGNSGPLAKDISEAILANDVDACAVLSGNRNFSGRINPLTKSAWLASPSLVIAYALAGNMAIDLDRDYLDKQGKVMLKDLWPSVSEVQKYVQKINQAMFTKTYADIFIGSKDWQALDCSEFSLQGTTSYLNLPNYLALKFSKNVKAKVLGVFKDKVTTDHISPAGSIAKNSDAAQYLIDKFGVKELHSYGARRGNHEVMKRGTFANPRIFNCLVGKEGNLTKVYINGKSKEMSFYQASKELNCDLVIFAGENYGTGSSRDFAAKGPRMLNVKAIFAKSFERIHKSNLIGMGIMPIIINEIPENLNFKSTIELSVTSIEKLQQITYYVDNKPFKGTLALQTNMEVSILLAGGFLPFIYQKINQK